MYEPTFWENLALVTFSPITVEVNDRMDCTSSFLVNEIHTAYSTAGRLVSFPSQCGHGDESSL
jgi:hypothetical protein